jgi:ABC-2 type transport system permease protein
MSPQDRANFDPAQSSVLGVALLGQLVIVVFGALMLTSEYSTGSMRTSLTVMPRRTCSTAPSWLSSPRSAWAWPW